MIKQLLVSLIIIAGVGTTAVASTSALLSDQATLSANTFSTGSVDLKIKVGGSGYADSQAGFTETLFPGQTETKFFKLKNASSGVALSIAAQAASVSGSIAANKVTIAFTPWTSGSLGGSAEAGAVTTSHTLADWLSSPSALGVPDIPNNGTQNYRMDVSIDSSVITPESSSTFDFVFTGTQVIP